MLKQALIGMAGTMVLISSMAADYDPIPKGWNYRINAPGTLKVGAEYCTESGKCHWVGENGPPAFTPSGARMPFIQACQMNPKQPECAAAEMPVQVLARNLAGGVIIRLGGKNFATDINGVYLVLDGRKLRPDEYPSTSTVTRAKSPSPVHTAAMKAYAGCLASRARAGAYSSADGGKSALRLMGDCQAEWKMQVDECVALGDTDADCTLRSGALAQMAIKLQGK